MAKKTFSSFSDLVYSTNPDAMQNNDEQESTDTPAPQQQHLHVRIERKHRGGKTVTIIEDFKGKQEDAEALGKLLKTKCGTGGSVKDNEILVQGDNKQKIMDLLKQLGYKVKG